VHGHWSLVTDLNQLEKRMDLESLVSRKLAGVPGMELSGRVLNSVRLGLSRGSMVLAGLDRFVCSSPSGRMEYELAVTSTVDALSRQNSLKSGD
jgi:hypothetical protein